MIVRRFQMTPYRTRLALNGATALVVVSIAFALAGLTWRLAGHAGTGAIAVAPARDPGVVPDIAPALALAPFGRSALATDAAVPTTLQLTLKGIVFAVPADLSSAFLQQSGETPRAYRVGEAVAGATIEAIQRDRVLIRNAGRVEFVAFPDPFARPGAPAAGAPPAPPPGNPIASAVPPPPAPDPAQLLQRFDAQPVANGYRVGANAPPGMREGDVIAQVNGSPLTNPDAARAALLGAQSSGTAQIQIVRDGKPLTVTVPIR